VDQVLSGFSLKNIPDAAVSALQCSVMSCQGTHGVVTGTLFLSWVRYETRVSDRMITV